MPDVNEPATGYLWGNLARHQLTYRNYGEYVTPGGVPIAPEQSGLDGRRPPDILPSCARREVKPWRRSARKTWVAARVRTSSRFR